MTNEKINATVEEIMEYEALFFHSTIKRAFLQSDYVLQIDTNS